MGSWIENELINSDQFRLSIPIQFQFKIFQFNSNSIHAELNWIDYQFQFNSWIDPSPDCQWLGRHYRSRRTQVVQVLKYWAGLGSSTFRSTWVKYKYFLWSSKSFTLPQPANHFFIKLNLLRVINTEISHACCSLCWKTYNTALNCRYCPLIVKLLPILLSQMTCRMLLGCSRCTLNFVCFTYLCFATTSTAENSTIQGRLKPSHKRLLRVNVSSHRHMT